MTAPLIVGLSGSALSAAEAAFLAAVRPLGVIVFARNLAAGPQALRRLVEAACSAASCELALVDQEGGRVQRLRPPLAETYPPARASGELFAADRTAGLRAAWLQGHLIAHDCLVYGLNVPCLPVADVAGEGMTDAIGDRSFGRDAEAVAGLSRAAAKGVLAAGALPVVKHMPGHGRARSDSHLTLPTVDVPLAELERDIAPFRALSDLPLAMTAHVRYPALDRHRPATLSPPAIALIREEIGFDGLLMTDDISMKALAGPVEESAREALAAGVDCVLHCNGDLAEMEAVANALPALSDPAARRLRAALASRRPRPSEPLKPLREEFAELLGARV